MVNNSFSSLFYFFLYYIYILFCLVVALGMEGERDEGKGREG